MADSGVSDETDTPAPVSRQRRSSEVTAAAVEVVSTPSACNDNVRVVDPVVCRPPSARRKFRTLTFGRHYKANIGGGQGASGGGASVGCKDGGGGGSKKKRKNPWTFRFNYRLRRDTTTDIPDPTSGSVACVCTGYRRTEEHHLGAGLVFQAAGPSDEQRPIVSAAVDAVRRGPYDQFPIEDWEERARAERARELEEGVDPPPGYRPSSVSPLLSARRPPQLLGSGHMLTSPFELKLSDLAVALQSRLTVQRRNLSSTSLQTSSPTGLEPAIGLLLDEAGGVPHRRTNVHTQVDYIHCLVPDLLDITRCAFYWGKMDRYEAERLLDGRPEGTFLLRDSAQDEYLFSVSFRRYGRSLHARVEQWNHRFSFDSHDPGVYSSTTVCGLVEHYKDPTCCMFFEPMLTLPLHRTFPFPLQHLCRAAIVGSRLTYDGVNDLRLPKPLKAYLKEYHYKQRVRVRLLEQ